MAGSAYQFNGVSGYSGLSGYSGYSGISHGYSTTFTNGDLSSGILTVTHNLGIKANVVQIYDNGDNMMIPDDVHLVNTNSLTVDLSSKAPITGTWTVVVVH